MFTLLVFLAVLAVLVLSHEWGHFVVARLQGIKVSEFGFGFPPRLFGIRFLKKPNKRFKIVWGKGAGASTDSDATLYSVNLIPLGGFVRIKGEDAGGAEATDPDSFSTKKVWQKSAVLLAGVFMNVVVAAVLLSATFMIGLPSMVAPGAIVSGPTTLRVMGVLPGKPAEVVGILPGDTILQVDALKSPRLTELQNYVNAHREEDITVVLERDGQQITKKIHPTVYADTGRGGIGVALTEIAFNRYPWPQAIYQGVVTTGVYLREIVLAFGHLFVALFTSAEVGGAVSGPVGVAVMTGEVARMGIVYLLQFTALLSLNLAVLNILPIPALDGGRLFFILIGAVRRRPIAPRVEQFMHTVSFILLMLLVVGVTVKDLGAFSGLFSSAWNSIF